ncbi:Putative esophageal gland cell secretory protein 6 [Durusdinium trenchii]|uniref:Esophageal gland cell secretory protein 6 n=1 Tax=Durusdinium trenchii TaxID=1381693 RepID=A0ABP0SD19_9DINO
MAEPESEPAEEPSKEVKKAPPPVKEASPAQLVGLVLAALALATTMSVVQGAQEIGLRRWSDSLFEKHVVPPPEVPNNVCTIQFCQS